MKNIPGAIIIEGHVQGLSNTRAMGEARIPVIVVDNFNCVARHSKYCQAFYKCPDFRSPEFIDFLIELGEKEKLQGWTLFPSNDHIVNNLSQNLEQINKLYKTTIPEPKLLHKIYNKEKLLHEAEKINIPIPPTFYPETRSLERFKLQFPVITKGKFGLTFAKTFGRKAFFASDENQLQDQLDSMASQTELCNTFVQEIIPDAGYNKTISFSAFCVDGEVRAHWTGQKIREHPWTFGTATFTHSIYNETIHQQSAKLLKQLKYTGICEVEFLYHPIEEKYMLIEINPRTWLWVSHARASGIDHALYAYNFLNGIENNYPASYELGVKWRNYWTDFFFSCQAMLKGKLKFKEYRRSFKGQMVDAVRSKDDPKPFREMTKMMIALAYRR